MSTLLGLLTGGFSVLDGTLALASPPAWRKWIMGVASFFPKPVDEYAREVVDVTERYRERAPSTMAGIFALEIVVGLAILRLAIRGR